MTAQPLFNRRKELLELVQDAFVDGSKTLALPLVATTEMENNWLDAAMADAIGLLLLTAYGPVTQAREDFIRAARRMRTESSG